MLRLTATLSFALAFLLVVPSAPAQRVKVRSKASVPSRVQRVAKVAKEVRHASGSVKLKLRGGKHTLRLPGTAKADLHVQEGTAARVSYKVGAKGRIESAEVKLSKPIEMKNLARGVAAEKTRSSFLPVRLFAAAATRLVNPKLRLEGFALQSTGSGFQVIPRVSGAVSLGPLRLGLNHRMGPQNLENLASMSKGTLSLQQGQHMFNQLVESMGGHFAAEVGMGMLGKSGSGSVKVSGDFTANPTARGFDLGPQGLALKLSGPGVRGDLQIKGSLEFEP